MSEFYPSCISTIGWRSVNKPVWTKQSKFVASTSTGTSKLDLTRKHLTLSKSYWSQKCVPKTPHIRPNTYYFRIIFVSNTSPLCLVSFHLTKCVPSLPASLLTYATKSKQSRKTWMNNLNTDQIMPMMKQQNNSIWSGWKNENISTEKLEFNCQHRWFISLLIKMATRKAL